VTPSEMDAKKLQEFVGYTLPLATPVP